MMSLSNRKPIALKGLVLSAGLCTLVWMGGCDAVIGLDQDYYQAVPDDWEGPLLLLDSIAEPNPCPEDFTDMGILNDGIFVAQIGPACACEVPDEACLLQVNIFDDNTLCTSLPDSTVSFEAGICHPLDVELGRVIVKKPVLSDFACVSQGNLLAQPQWQKNVRLCAGRAGACISRIGEHSCPTEGFSERRVLYDSYLDTRDCDCGQVQGVCEGTLGIINEDSLPGYTPLEACENNFVTLTAGTNECVGPINVDYVRYNLTEVELSCAVNGEGGLVGELLPASPVTLCCRP